MSARDTGTGGGSGAAPPAGAGRPPLFPGGVGGVGGVPLPPSLQPISSVPSHATTAEGSQPSAGQLPPAGVRVSSGSAAGAAGGGGFSGGGGALPPLSASAAKPIPLGRVPSDVPVSFGLPPRASSLVPSAFASSAPMMKVMLSLSLSPSRARLLDARTRRALATRFPSRRREGARSRAAQGGFSVRRFCLQVLQENEALSGPRLSGADGSAASTGGGRAGLGGLGGFVSHGTATTGGGAGLTTPQMTGPNGGFARSSSVPPVVALSEAELAAQMLRFVQV